LTIREARAGLAFKFYLDFKLRVERLKDCKTGYYEEELHNLYSSPNRMIESSGMRWVGHVARMGRRGIHSVLVGKPEEKQTTRKV
jgi:hypothetical protein